MSLCKCAECEKIYDTDYQMEVNKDGNCICDECAEKLGNWD